MIKRLHFHLGFNPIIVKELRSRMRGPRAFITLTGILALLAGVSYLLYRMALVTQSYSTAPLSPQIGQALFLALAMLELVMVCAVAPAVTAGAISGEQEKLTYEMLLTTPLHPGSILWGKLVSAMSYVFLLIFAAIPMSSLIFIFGGVAPRELLKVLVIIIAVAAFFGVLGLFMSTWIKRTTWATVLSYLVVALLSFGTLFLYATLTVIRGTEMPRWILVPNPVSALLSALSPSMPSSGAPLGIFGSLGMVLGGNFSSLAGTSISQTSIPRPLYHYTLPFYGAVVLGLYLLSTRLILPTRRWRLGRKDLLWLLALVLVYGGAVGGAFFATADRYEKRSIFVAPTPAPAFAQPMGGVIMEKSMRVMAVPVAPTEAPVLPVINSDYSSAEQGGIYAAVVRQLYDKFYQGQLPESGTIYLNQMVDDSAGDPASSFANSGVLSEETQAALAVELVKAPFNISWVGTPDSAPFYQDTGKVKDGVIITLGSIRSQKDGSVQVPTALYTDNAGNGMGLTYVLEKKDDFWQVTGDTGNPWQK